MDHVRIVPVAGIDIIHDVIGFTGASFSRRGEIILRLAVRNGVNFRIDASTNLVDWITSVRL